MIKPGFRLYTTSYGGAKFTMQAKSAKHFATMLKGKLKSLGMQVRMRSYLQPDAVYDTDKRLWLCAYDNRYHEKPIYV